MEDREILISIVIVRAELINRIIFTKTILNIWIIIFGNCFFQKIYSFFLSFRNTEIKIFNIIGLFRRSVTDS